MNGSAYSNDHGRISRRTLLMGAAGGAVVLGGGGVLANHEINTHPRLRRFFGRCGSTPPLPDMGTYTVRTATLTSKAMRREMPYCVAIPARLPSHADIVERRTPLVVALPGDGGSETDFADEIGLPNFAHQGGLLACFVSPGDVDSSYYHPRSNGSDMLSFLVDELVPHVEGRYQVGGSVANRAAYGVSMGGFGALLLAQQHPELFSTAVAESPAVFTSYEEAITGHSRTFDSAADWERYGVWSHLSGLASAHVRIDCGDADPFAGTARQLLSRIPNAVGGIASGCHERGFWRRSAPGAIEFLKEFLT